MDKLLEYESIIEQENSLAKRKKILADEIKNSMLTQNATETPMLRAGKIFLASKKKWKYSADVDRLNELVEQQKLSEEHDNVAECTETQYITYRKSS